MGAAFTQWSLSAAQEVAAKAETFMTGTYSLEDLKVLFESVPTPVRDLAGVAAFHLELGSKNSAPPIAAARGPLTALKNVGTQCEKWYGSQQASAGASAGGGSGGVPPTPAGAPAAKAVAKPAAKKEAKK